jgi:DNA-binding MarR family transcriptional regulator
MAKKLTRRQLEFLSKFLDLYQEMDGPIHYAALAERLGVGNVTAYEMLRLLEERGLVGAEYHLPEGDRGPGRSSVLFRPTPKAERALQRLNGGSTSDKDWNGVKKQIISQLKEHQAAGYESFLNELLSRLPDQPSPLVFLTEMNTAIILALHSLQERAGNLDPLKKLNRIGLPGEIDLSAVPGIGLSLSLVEQINQKISSGISAQAGRYQAVLAQLSEEKLHLLSEFTRRISRIVRSRAKNDKSLPA